MKLNTDITRYAGMAIGIILGISGLRHMIDMKIYGRVHMAGADPLVQGWPVFLFGLLELVAGLVVLVWMYRKRG